jgi:membrane-associated protein
VWRNWVIPMMQDRSSGPYRGTVDFLSDALLAMADSPWVFALVCAVCVIDGFFPPIPSEPVVIALAAVALPHGGVGVLPLLAAAAAGAIVGDNIAYALGSRFGTERFAILRRPRIAAVFRRARSELATRGAFLLLTARYVPVGRTAVNMTAGATGYPRLRFLGLSALGGITWAAYSVFVGSAVAHLLGGQPLLSVVVAVSLAATLGILIDLVIRRVARQRARRVGGIADAAPLAEPLHRRG